MKEKQFESWKRQREKGKKNYVLYNGVLAYGLPMFIVMTFFVNKPESGSMSFWLLAANLVLWAVAGLIFGLGTWHAFEKKFNKELARRQNT